MRRELPPIQPYLDAIDQAKTIEELMAVQNRVYEETGGTLFMGFGLNIDVKDNTAYTLLFDGITPSLGQGGYSTATPEQKAAYQTYVRTMLTLVGQSEAAASAAADTILAGRRQNCGGVLEQPGTGGCRQNL